MALENGWHFKMNYKEEAEKAMKMLGEHPKTIFLGQTVEYKGSAMFGSLKFVPPEKKMELPIMEDTQMGMSIGLSLAGFIPISIFPRQDFMICAMNQLVNHLDKTREMSNGEFSPKVIIRTMVGGTQPLYPGVQHCSDYTEALKILLKDIDVVKLEKAEEIVPAYKRALESSKSTLLIEIADLYNQDIIEGKSTQKD
jgi:pyruvate/2-oxoglutarate/acetoin dehydrogenase E1 component